MTRSRTGCARSANSSAPETRVDGEGGWDSSRLPGDATPAKPLIDGREHERYTAVIEVWLAVERALQALDELERLKSSRSSVANLVRVA